MVIFQVNIEFDYSSLGYSSANASKIGFYAEKCGVSMAESPSTVFYLVGSGDNSGMYKKDENH